jgi:hypothetical protein
MVDNEQLHKPWFVAMNTETGGSKSVKTSTHVHQNAAACSTG